MIDSICVKQKGKQDDEKINRCPIERGIIYHHFILWNNVL
jgi:hypothetical protein